MVIGWAALLTVKAADTPVVFLDNVCVALAVAVNPLGFFTPFFFFFVALTVDFSFTSVAF